MGFLDKFRKKKEQQISETQSPADEKKDAGPPPGKRIKKYTSDGKPIYE